MIYEQINNAYESLANQWRDLAQAIRRLAESLPVSDPLRNPLYNPSAAIGLAYDCDRFINPDFPGAVNGHRQDAESEALPLPVTAPIGLIITNADIALTGYELDRVSVSSIFNALFPPPPPGGAAEAVEIQDVREELENLRIFIAGVIQTLREHVSDEATRANIGGLRGSVDNIASYPMLTSELAIMPPMSSPSGPGYGGMAPLQRTVEATLREVLGHLPRTRDTRSFVLALNQSFQVQTVEGHTEVAWTPRSYSGQTELGGGVTGAQASLYTRSRVALDNALPLLDGLYPLLPDYDPQLVEASRSIVRSEFTEIINELGTEGGPRVARVDQLFISMLDEQMIDPRTGAFFREGHLGYLQRVYGLTTDQINTLEEERDVTNFISLRDYALSIRQSWVTFRSQWHSKDLGTRLVFLARALAVAAETVDEINFAMDSVFVGPAERKVAAFRDEYGNSVLVDELLTWVQLFTGEEAPYLVREAGKRGAAAIIPTAQILVRQVTRFIEQIPYEPDLPSGLRHPRVLPPLRELRTYLQRVADLAQDINRPIP